MKKIVILIGLVVFNFSVNAQETVAGKVLKNAKDKTYQRGEQKGDEGVEGALNKAEEKIKNIFKKKEKKSKEATETQESTNSDAENNNQQTKSSTRKPVKSNSKFDFVAGEKELYFDNFERLNIGDFPAEFKYECKWRNCEP